MTNLVLLVCLHEDEANTLASAAEHYEKRQHVTLIKRDGVILLSDNLVLLDPTKSHASLVQLSAMLEQKSWPYLLFRIDGQASLASGTLPAEVEALLATVGVPCVPQCD